MRVDFKDPWPSNIADLMPRLYVGCIYDDDWFVRSVIEISQQIVQTLLKKEGSKFWLPPPKGGI